MTRTALVTGAASGIGAACLPRLGDAGYRTLGVDIADRPGALPAHLSAHRARRGLAANQIPMALAEPEEVAQVVLDAIQHDRFWAHFDHQHDPTIFGGRMGPLIEWQNNVIRARADAIINRGRPDAYLWSGSAPAS